MSRKIINKNLAKVNFVLRAKDLKKPIYSYFKEDEITRVILLRNFAQTHRENSPKNRVAKFD